ncbi:two-component system response regulator VirR, partial [Listeria monocytogenes]
KQKGSIVSRDEIMRALWEDESFVDDNTLTVNVVRIRKKLAEIGLSEFIKTKKGQGYMIE